MQTKQLGTIEAEEAAAAQSHAEQIVENKKHVENLERQVQLSKAIMTDHVREFSSSDIFNKTSAVTKTHREADQQFLDAGQTEIDDMRGQVGALDTVMEAELSVYEPTEATPKRRSTRLDTSDVLIVENDEEILVPRVHTVYLSHSLYIHCIKLVQ